MMGDTGLVVQRKVANGSGEMKVHGIMQIGLMANQMVTTKTVLNFILMEVSMMSIVTVAVDLFVKRKV